MTRSDLADLRRDLAAMEARLTWRMVVLAGAVAAFATVLKRLVA